MFFLASQSSAPSGTAINKLLTDIVTPGIAGSDSPTSKGIIWHRQLLANTSEIYKYKAPVIGFLGFSAESGFL